MGYNGGLYNVGHLIIRIGVPLSKGSLSKGSKRVLRGGLV